MARSALRFTEPHHPIAGALTMPALEVVTGCFDLEQLLMPLGDPEHGSVPVLAGGRVGQVVHLCDLGQGFPKP